jgi:alpha-tubulin suppressor-like RCC1 family protein
MVILYDHTGGAAVLWHQTLYEPAYTLTRLAAAAPHSLALDQDGNAWASGSNHVPTGVTFVVAATGHPLALDEEGTAWSWGDDLYGQRGDGNRFPRGTPARVGR